MINKANVYKMSLRPYHGEIWLCKTPEIMKATYKKITKAEWPHGEICKKGGKYCLLENGSPEDNIYLVYAYGPAVLAHEIGHVLLIMFNIIGHDPRQGDGEPFCYMLSQLMLDAGY